LPWSRKATHEIGKSYSENGNKNIMFKVFVTCVDELLFYRLYVINERLMKISLHPK